MYLITEIGILTRIGIITTILKFPDLHIKWVEAFDGADIFILL